MKAIVLTSQLMLLAAPAPDVEVLDISWRVTKSTQSSSKIAWKELVRNNTWNLVAFTLVVELKDWDGFILGDDRVVGLSLNDAETKELAGTVRLSTGLVSSLDEAVVRVEMR